MATHIWSPDIAHLIHIGDGINVLFCDEHTKTLSWNVKSLRLSFVFRAENYSSAPGLSMFKVVIIQQDNIVKDATVTLRCNIDGDPGFLRENYDLLLPIDGFPTEDITINYNVWAFVKPNFYGNEFHVFMKTLSVTIKKPTLQEVEATVASSREALERDLQNYRRRMETRQSKRSKRKKAK